MTGFSFDAIGTTAHLLVDRPASGCAGAERLLREFLDDLDRACSRFRADSALTRLNRDGGPVVDRAAGGRPWPFATLSAAFARELARLEKVAASPLTAASRRSGRARLGRASCLAWRSARYVAKQPETIRSIRCRPSKASSPSSGTSGSMTMPAGCTQYELTRTPIVSRSHHTISARPMFAAPLKKSHSRLP